MGGKERLIETAERLFAQRGITGVSLRQIGAAAGQRNTAAVLYHFGSKEALLDALHERLRHRLEVARADVLSEPPPADRAGDLRYVIRGLVYPFASMLTPGTYAARFLAQRLSDPNYGESFLSLEEETVRRLAARVRPALPELPRATLLRRVRLAHRFFIHALAAHERELDHKRQRAVRTTELADDLVEMIVAMLSAPAPPKRR